MASDSVEIISYTNNNMYSFTTQGATPNTPQGSNPNPTGGTSAARALNNAQGIQAPPPIPLVPPMTSKNGPVKSHSITHPDGTVVTQTFHNPEQGMLSGSKTKTAAKPAPAQTPETMPEIKVINGMHHVPFKASDGSIKYVNAKGEIS